MKPTKIKGVKHVEAIVLICNAVTDETMSADAGKNLLLHLFKISEEDALRLVTPVKQSEEA